jgi:hypothetical protein
MAGGCRISRERVKDGRDWGVDPHAGGGKSVWAEFSLA